MADTIAAAPEGCILRKFVAPEFVFGADARMWAGRYAKNFGMERVLVVTDAGVEASGWADEVLRTLREVAVPYVVFSGVTSNPKAEEVMEGARVYLDEDCDGIVAVGGGSPMDCAKGIGIVVSAGGRNILEFTGIDRVEEATPLLLCVPTTAGTAAEISQFAIITDTARDVKTGVISKAIVPDVALIDPVITTTMDSYLTACTALDALCHGIEAYASRAHSPITDLHALEGIRLVRENLLLVLDAPHNLDLRCRVMLGSVHTGLAFSNASLGAVHALSHSVGGLLDFAHGEANGLLMAPVIRRNYPAAPERYRRIAEVFGIGHAGAPDDEVRDMLVDGIRLFCRSAGVTTTLGTLGMCRNHLSALAENAVADPCMITNPRRFTVTEVEDIYAELL